MLRNRQMLQSNIRQYQIDLLFIGLPVKKIGLVGRHENEKKNVLAVKK